MPRFEALRELQFIDDMEILGKLLTLVMILFESEAQDRLVRMAQQRMLKRAMFVLRRLTLPPLVRGEGVPGIRPIELLAPEGAFLVIIDTGGGT